MPARSFTPSHAHTRSAAHLLNYSVDGNLSTNSCIVHIIMIKVKHTFDPVIVYKNLNSQSVFKRRKKFIKSLSKFSFFEGLNVLKISNHISTPQATVHLKGVLSFIYRFFLSSLTLQQIAANNCLVTFLTWS